MSERIAEEVAEMRRQDRLTDLRRQCAEAMGKKILPAEGSMDPTYVYIESGADSNWRWDYWRPDKDPAQLVECIQFLMKHHYDTTTLTDLICSLAGYLEFEDMDWREAIMRAVCAVGEGK